MLNIKYSQCLKYPCYIPSATGADLQRIMRSFVTSSCLHTSVHTSGCMSASIPSLRTQGIPFHLIVFAKAFIWDISKRSLLCVTWMQWIKRNSAREENGVCSSAPVFQLQTCREHLYGTWYECYAIGDPPTIGLYNSRQSVRTIWCTNKFWRGNDW